MAAHPGSLESIIAKLIHQLKDHDESVRLHAAAALGLMGRKAHAAIPALTDALRDSDRFVRKMAASALEVIVPKEARARSA
jgi:HEAT repeat protein